MNSNSQKESDLFGRLQQFISGMFTKKPDVPVIKKPLIAKKTKMKSDLEALGY